MISTQHKRFQQRLAKIEQELAKKNKDTPAPLYAQVQEEAHRELSPEEQVLLESGLAARREGAFTR